MNPAPAKPKGTVALQARIDPDLYEALGRLARKNHRSRNGQLVVILEAFAKKEGEWPPPSNPSPE